MWSDVPESSNERSYFYVFRGEKNSIGKICHPLSAHFITASPPLGPFRALFGRMELCFMRRFGRLQYSGFCFNREKDGLEF